MQTTSLQADDTDFRQKEDQPLCLRKKLIVAFYCLLSFRAGLASLLGDDLPTAYTNSLGMKLVPIQAGVFRMGTDSRVSPQLKGPCHLPEGDWDERPAHKVAIQFQFDMGVSEVTEEQYRAFDPGYKNGGTFTPYVTGVSWNDAVAFCQWLSRKESKNYRLPTEAEWEYACRAGTATPFSSGDELPLAEVANPWGLKNMHTGPMEWCLDWYGPYLFSDQTDPTGPTEGIFKVIRGGGLQQVSPQDIYDPFWNLGLTPYYSRSANRSALPPDYHGQEPVGFRIVAAPEIMGTGPTLEAPFVRQCVKQRSPNVEWGPDPAIPYFSKRHILPVPPVNSSNEAIRAAGLHPGFLGHNHSPALEVCPNGDVLAIYYSAARYSESCQGRSDFGEISPDVALIATRLRYGSEEWEMPSLLYDIPDIADQAPLLWNNDGVLNLFWGGPGPVPYSPSGVPFKWVSSRDNGSSWDSIKFPILQGPVGAFNPQPINSAFRGFDGTIYLPTDGVGGTSVLWASHDDGRTWSDTGGRTGGRHSTCAPLKDGAILCLGGKDTDIDGYMPQSVSYDGGRTWKVSRTSFPAVGGNQRPTLIRLKSGRLFFASDYQHKKGNQPKGVTERGSYVAVSEDEGKTWQVRKLPHTLPHESEPLPDKAATLGYAVARQGSNGVIHLITSMNEPCMHFEINEAWVLQKEQASAILSHSSDKIIREQENYPDGRIRARWSGLIASDGRYLLHDQETWFYPNGQRQWEVTYRKGRKVGWETYWSSEGRKSWAWLHHPDATALWVQWWPNGQKKVESTWRDGRCEGTASQWDAFGKILTQKQFVGGKLLK